MRCKYFDNLIQIFALVAKWIADKPTIPFLNVLSQFGYNVIKIDWSTINIQASAKLIPLKSDAITILELNF